MARPIAHIGAAAVVVATIVSGAAQTSFSPAPTPSSADMNGIYGALPRAVDTRSAGRTAAFVDDKLNRDFQDVSAAEERGLTPLPSRRGRKGAAPVDLHQLTSLDRMGMTVDGGAPTAGDLLDGPIAQDANAPSVSAGASPPAFAFTAPAGMSPTAPRPTKAADAKGVLDAPTGEHADLFADPNPSGAPVAPLRTPPLHPKIYDVSEGTKMDPLKNHDYDLNSGKDIPAELLGK